MSSRFSEKVNAAAMMISGMTNDIGERHGIASALLAIYQHELQKNLAMVPVPAENEKPETAPESADGV